MPKPKGSTGGRLVHLDARVYRIVLWLLSDCKIELGFKASSQEMEEAQKQRTQFVLVGDGDIEWPRGYRLNHKKTGKLYIPDDAKHLVLNEFHPRDSPNRKGTHHGQRRTHRKIAQHHYNITQHDVKEWIERCTYCIKSNCNRNAIDDLVPILSKYVNQRWVIDTTYMLELETTNEGYKYIATGMDHFSKFPFAIPLKGRTATDWAEALITLFYLYDAPDVLHADNGCEFKNQLFLLIKERVGIDLVHGNPYSPNEQGLVEKWNHTLKTELTKLMNQHNTSNWVQFLPRVCASYTMTPHLVTGVTPFELYFGRKPQRLIAIDGPEASPELPQYTAEDYATEIQRTSERMGVLTDLVMGRIEDNGEKMKKQKAKKAPKKRFAVGDKVHVFYGALPSKVARRLYGDSVVIKKATKSTKGKEGKSGKRSRTKKLRVGQEPYLATGVITAVTQFKRYRVTLDSGEEIKSSIRSNYLKPAVINAKTTITTTPAGTNNDKPSVNKDSPPDLVSDSVSQSSESSSSCSTDTGSTSDSASGTEQSDSEDYSNLSESDADLTQFQTTYSTRHSVEIQPKKGSLSAQYKAIAVEAKDQILVDSTRSRSKKNKYDC